jgi:hypothetical protein
LDERRLAAFAAGHPRALGLGLPVGVAVLIFLVERGFGAGWGNVLAGGILAISLWLGMKLVLSFLGSVPRDIADTD